MNSVKEIHVYWAEREDTPIGILRHELVRGRGIFSFSGGKAWLEHRILSLLDPDLGQFEGPQYLRDRKRNFGLFLDSSPDRWGRMLIKRREAVLARKEKRRPRDLDETDFLLGVFDGSRMGALRFKLDDAGPFLDDNRDLATPPWTAIRDLEYASMALEREENSGGPEEDRWINMLVRPGSSLGGARPKANVTDAEGSLWIAKFPRGGDEKDSGAWEKILHELAESCGITVSESRAEQFSGTGHTFLSKRFDRKAGGARIHFASAMTLLGADDGAGFTEGISYLDLAEFIIRRGVKVEANLEELWRRMAFNIAVSNCDDHLRNHGFILREGGWTLSPAYDLNPDESGIGLALNISENDNSLDFDLAMEVSPYFRIPPSKAVSILDTIKKTVRCWRSAADKYRIPRAEQARVEAAFRV
ncbi:MAG: HipA domain-containing protein [Spirochaetaceae bacterium]|jgi:serine/threonine-protein kinase HipA|nr:HipA domain-containing protein [Spirochaetaceae bacterium]